MKIKAFGGGASLIIYPRPLSSSVRHHDPWPSHAPYDSAFGREIGSSGTWYATLFTKLLDGNFYYYVFAKASSEDEINDDLAAILTDLWPETNSPAPGEFWNADWRDRTFAKIPQDDYDFWFATH